LDRLDALIFRISLIGHAAAIICTAVYSRSWTPSATLPVSAPAFVALQFWTICVTASAARADSGDKDGYFLKWGPIGA
jgi:hypothetical protein